MLLSRELLEGWVQQSGERGQVVRGSTLVDVVEEFLLHDGDVRPCGKEWWCGAVCVGSGVGLLVRALWFRE